MDNHSPGGGLGDHLLHRVSASGRLRGKRLLKLAVKGFPACGAPAEVLRHHGLDAESLATRNRPR